jgi:hypothetical protein
MDERGIVEPVAIAIWGEWSLWAPPVSHLKPSWDELADGNKEIGRKLARAAISAMHKPTGVMVEAGERAMGACGAHDCEVGAADIYRAMIAEASKS